LEAGTDYTLEFSDNTDAGVGHVSIVGQGLYSGTVSREFSIVYDLSQATVSTVDKQTYTGSKIKPQPTVKLGDKVLAEGQDYKLTYGSNINVGTGSFVVGPTSRSEGQKKYSFKIASAPIKKAKVAPIKNKTYQAKAIKPNPVITYQGKKLRLNHDYKLVYKNNVKAGKARITVKGIGNFTGTRTVYFRIVKAPVSKFKVAKVKSATYSGAQIKPSPRVTYAGKQMQRGKDYKLTFKGNVQAGKASVIITGINNWKGTRVAYFIIKKAPASKFKVGKISAKTYTGSSITPSVSVSYRGKQLKSGRDYTLSYENNVSPGSASVVIVGKGNFTGKKVVHFTIRSTSAGTRSGGGSSGSGSGGGGGSGSGSGGGSESPVSDTVYITNTGECYHRDGCSSLSRSRIPIDRSSAIAQGYRACSRCNP
jgi:uncharacterized membrane protein YgcG